MDALRSREKTSRDLGGEGGKEQVTWGWGGECSQAFQQRPLSVDAGLYGSKAKGFSVLSASLTLN